MSPARSFVALAVLFLGGCPKQIADFRVIRLARVQVSAIDGEGFTMTVSVEIENPNRLDAEVSNLAFRTYSGKHLLGRGQHPGPVMVPAGRRIVLALPCRVSFDTLPPDLPRRVADGQIDLRTEARFTASTGVGTFEMDLVSRGKTAVDKAIAATITGSFRGPALRVVSIDLARFELRRVRLRVTVRARNLFPFPIRIRRTRYRLEINGAPFGEGERGRSLTLPAKGTVDTTFPVAATHGAVGRALGALLGSDPSFHVTGTVWIDPIAGVSRIPFEVAADSSVFAPQR